LIQNKKSGKEFCSEPYSFWTNS